MVPGDDQAAGVDYVAGRFSEMTARTRSPFRLNTEKLRSVSEPRMIS